MTLLTHPDTFKAIHVNFASAVNGEGAPIVEVEVEVGPLQHSHITALTLPHEHVGAR